jgi:glycerophosphoryl diester phosphodiesterase
MPLILGHRGFSARYLENSMASFKAAMEAGMDGFEFDVRSTRDGVCVALHDEDLGRTAQAAGIVNDLRAEDLPLLKNGEPVPRVSEVLNLPFRLANAELKERRIWQKALMLVLEAGVLPRILFSSFRHEEIYELHAACSEARCGLLCTTAQALALARAGLEGLPPDLMLNLPLGAVEADPEFWAPHRNRLLIWGMKSTGEAVSLLFEPAILVSDGI